MKKRTLFVSAMLGAMAMTATLTSCVKDEVSADVKAEKTQLAQVNAGYSYTNAQEALKNAKNSLAYATTKLEQEKSKLATLQSGVAPLTEYWEREVAKAENELAEAKKTLETLENLKGINGESLSAEWAKADSAYNAAEKAYKTATASSDSKKQIVSNDETALRAVPAVKLDNEWSALTNPASETEVCGIKYEDMKATVGSTVEHLFVTSKKSLDSNTVLEGVKKASGLYISECWYMAVNDQAVVDSVIKNQLKPEIEKLEKELGKADDKKSTEANATLYAKLAQAKANLAEATEQKKGKDVLIDFTDEVATAQENVDEKIAKIKVYNQELADFQTFIAEVQKGVPAELVATYIADIKAYNQALKDTEAAQTEMNLKQSVKTALSQITFAESGSYSTIEQVIADGKNYVTKKELALVNANRNAQELYNEITEGYYQYNDYTSAIENCNESITEYTNTIAYYNDIIPVLEKRVAYYANKK